MDEPEPMTRFPVPDAEELPADLRERIEAETERAGFTPNVFLAYGYVPEQFRAFFAYYDALIQGSSLSRREIEAIIVVVSAANDCYYCNVAHGALVRLYGEDPLLADQLISNYRIADVSDRELAILEFAVTLTDSPECIGEADLERLEDHGLSRREIWDVGAVAAFFNLSNRMAHLADMRPNPEFHTLGR